MFQILNVNFYKSKVFLNKRAISKSLLSAILESEEACIQYIKGEQISNSNMIVGKFLHTYFLEFDKIKNNFLIGEKEIDYNYNKSFITVSNYSNVVFAYESFKKKYLYILDAINKSEVEYLFVAEILFENRNFFIKGIIDYLLINENEIIIYDLKTVRFIYLNENDEQFNKIIINYGYDLQAYIYKTFVDYYFKKYNSQFCLTFISKTNLPLIVREFNVDESFLTSGKKKFISAMKKIIKLMDKFKINDLNELKKIKIEL